MKRAQSRDFVCGGQAGIGMLEVLIAILIVSIGFLGTAALQVSALATNNSAMARSVATVASYSIGDAMRADPSGVKAGDYDTTVTATSCPTGVGLANTQLIAWCKQLGAVLGEAATTKGTISCVGKNCTVTIEFDDRHAGGSETQTVTTRMSL